MLLRREIARRSGVQRRPRDVADVGVDLANKEASKLVQKREQGEGREVGCRREAGVAGVHDGELGLPSEMVVA